MLYFTPSTKEDSKKLKNLLDDSPFHYEYEYTYFSFEEEDLDALEIALTEIIDSNDINGYFESV